MATENPEKAFYEVEDNSAGDPKVEYLKGLLKNVQVNRRAMGIIRAMKGGDKKAAAQIAAEAKGAGIGIDELNVAWKMLKGK